MHGGDVVKRIASMPCATGRVTVTTRMAGARRIAFVTHLRCGYTQRLVRGVLRYADEHGPFTIRDFTIPRRMSTDPPYPAQVQALLDWRPEGIASALMDDDLRPLRRLVGDAMPQVNLFASTPGPHLAVVNGSHRHVVAAAVRHLHQVGIRTPAFLRIESGAGELNARRSILETLPSIDLARDLLIHPVDIGIVEDPDAPVLPIPQAIVDWLAGLPRPAGVFCSSIGSGNYLLRVCHELGLRVPEDIAVIGTDDSDISLRSDPSLTSVMPVGEQVGQEGMRVLDDLIRTGIAPRSVVRIEAVEVTIRRSTGRGVDRCDIPAAMAFIERNACRGIGVDDVLAHTQHASRMTFYKEFQRVTGRSPGEVIRACQLGEARRLLGNSQLTVTQIATLCGFSDGSTFARLFRTATGATPSAYRLRGHREPAPTAG